MKQKNFKGDYQLTKEETEMLENEDYYSESENGQYGKKRLIVTPAPKKLTENLKDLGIDCEEWSFDYAPNGGYENIVNMSAVIFNAEDAIYRTILRANRECQISEASIIG